MYTENKMNSEQKLKHNDVLQQNVFNPSLMYHSPPIVNPAPALVSNDAKIKGTESKDDTVQISSSLCLQPQTRSKPTLNNNTLQLPSISPDSTNFASKNNAHTTSVSSLSADIQANNNALNNMDQDDDVDSTLNDNANDNGIDAQQQNQSMFSFLDTHTLTTQIIYL